MGASLNPVTVPLWHGPHIGACKSVYGRVLPGKGVGGSIGLDSVESLELRGNISALNDCARNLR